MKPSVYVIGGKKGLVGARVVSLLRASLASQIEIVLAGRRAPFKVDVRQPTSLAEALRAGDIVIDAAGPHRRDPQPLVDVCVEKGAHYIDVSLSPRYQSGVRRALSRHEAKSVTSVVMTGCSTIPAMAEALLPLLVRPGVRVLKRNILLSVGTRYPLSASLLYSVLRPLGRRHGAVTWWREKTGRELGDGRWRTYGSFPSSWPLDYARFWAGFDHSIYWYLLRGCALVLPAFPDGLLFRLCQVSRPFVSLLRLFGTRRGSLRVELTDEHNSIRALEVRALEDGVAIAAMPAVWAVSALITGDKETLPAGVVELTDLVTAKEVAANLQAHGHIVQVRREVTY